MNDYPQFPVHTCHDTWVGDGLPPPCQACLFVCTAPAPFIPFPVGPGPAAGQSFTFPLKVAEFKLSDADVERIARRVVELLKEPK